MITVVEFLAGFLAGFFIVLYPLVLKEMMKNDL